MRSRRNKLSQLLRKRAMNGYEEVGIELKYSKFEGIASLKKVAYATGQMLSLGNDPQFENFFICLKAGTLSWPYSYRNRIEPLYKAFKPWLRKMPNKQLSITNKVDFGHIVQEGQKIRDDIINRRLELSKTAKFNLNHIRLSYFSIKHGQREMHIRITMTNDQRLLLNNAMICWAGTYVAKRIKTDGLRELRSWERDSWTLNIDSGKITFLKDA